MKIDIYLPEYYFSEKHKIDISASRQNVFNAIVDLTPGEISFLFKFLFFIRSIPPKMLGGRHIGFDSKKPLLRQLEEKGFKILETTDHEIVLGVIGRFGKMKNDEIYKMGDFKKFNEKGAGKVVMNFCFAEIEDRGILSTETRIYLCDEKSKRRFALYWMIVSPGSALIRRLWLKAIKKKAE